MMLPPRRSIHDIMIASAARRNRQRRVDVARPHVPRYAMANAAMLSYVATRARLQHSAVVDNVTATARLLASATAFLLPGLAGGYIHATVVKMPVALSLFFAITLIFSRRALFHNAPGKAACVMICSPPWLLAVIDRTCSLRRRRVPATQARRRCFCAAAASRRAARCLTPCEGAARLRA